MRQLPQVHKRFFRLKFGEKFEINGVTFQKETPFRAVTSFGSLIAKFIWPWTKVRTCELVRDARPGGLSSKDLPWRGMVDMTVNGRRHEDDNRSGPSC